MNLISIPAFQDNYIWLLANPQKHCIIVDPGESAPVLTALSHGQYTPQAILLTHHHHDHVGGVADLRHHFPNIPVYGPQETANKGATIIVNGGDNLTIGDQNYHIFAVPGHTLGHIAYYSKPYLFCGDTLFSAGCGRLFEGTPEQMYTSIQQLAQLPDETLICSAHEYTLANLKFARSILPSDQEIATYQQEIMQLRAKNLPSLPVKLHLERKINVFLRCNDIDLQREIGVSSPPSSLASVFSELRARKDRF
ncbi:hydroxyacylglutathione hydrolase [Yersinia massiliensis]|jgi:hydroxyacylglutathione hydrolase|uniref:Hydroxyacylglutathione hydrolase n=1 Tax=Yersinia massiliensis TaxID=419257 RepID=A0AA91B959_9GAMM|nr:MULTISPECIES: hydroxyacylglutathione hydrolase [Yersinia]HEC1651125.1 hydroxyacylglutathione hydrolase [Yersinia enterocolitica]MDA5550183.1 hydroxyacylglutathione hydrolase [Yersinia massiliensis]NIL29002.1 hydroxyacylglutathione hydrolase [Yersinia massiliensis]UZM80071.1 hydroxyacylglutathione hydrolase [Yersinia massiliensis]CNL37912.1 putative hydroxyacylglutathione hydrolase [Yersinia frederiksenii]